MIYHNYSHYKFFWLNVFGLIYSTENIIMAYIVGTLTNMATRNQFSKVSTFFYSDPDSLDHCFGC